MASRPLLHTAFCIADEDTLKVTWCQTFPCSTSLGLSGYIYLCFRVLTPPTLIHLSLQKVLWEKAVLLITTVQIGSYWIKG